MLQLALNFVTSLGGIVLIPIVIIILGLIVQLRPTKAILAGLTVGIGMIGTNAIISILSTALEPAVQAMVSNFGLSLSILDVGNGIGGPLAFSTTLGIIIIPIAIFINLVLIFTGLTKTLNVDIWNLWQSAFVGIMTWGVTGDYLLAILVMVPFCLIELILADAFQPKVSEFFNLPGISITHVMALSGLVLATPINWLFDHIPFFKRTEIDPETIQKKFGFFGNPIIIGFIIGIVMGVLAGFEFGHICQLGMETAAVLALLPKMIAMFMEGLTPIAGATQEFTSKHLHGKTLNIGMDAALTVGNPAVLAVSLLMIPVTLLLAVILPGNKVLPLGDLPMLVYALCLTVAAYRGDIIRSVLGSAVYVVTMLYLSTWIAPAFTSAYQIAGYDAGGSIVSFVTAGLWPNVITLGSAQFFGYAGVGILTVILLGILFYMNRIKKWNQA